MMSDKEPKRIIEFVVGLDDRFNFVNVLDPAKPTPLRTQLTERSLLVFTLSDQLIKAGWIFQGRPIEVDRDYGVNFSSFVWVEHSCDDKPAPRSSFKMIYECARLGEYTYSLFLQDSMGQKLTLDPVFDNGTGHVP